ncbi:exonuclease [Mycobacterium phage Barnyard]|uniref:PD-(D/E)XK endonuclease-like domain-containing protein n=1 Tax=Mycobacterium phage Barnyard TaxID=205880 RepID=Q856A0_9CAUD|nr:exonuclease [Mycobacterium phage Barnyard]AAN02126.1 hypothetical protein PBI_BARNYARD_72 [Mycobacterium phage Barnyard]
MIDLPLMRNSERKDFKTCQTKWNWSWNHGLVLKIPTTSAAWFGTGWHLVWAEYYTPPKGKDGFHRGRDPHETWAEYCKGEYAAISSGPYWDEVAEKEWHDAEALGHIMIDNYLAEYGNPADPHWEVLMPETRIRAKIPYNARQISSEHYGIDHLSRGKFITELVGTIDMPIRDHSFDPPRIVVVDHKTTNKKENVRWLTKDDQGGSYIAIGTPYLRKHGLILPDESIWGAIWSYARKGKAPDPATTDNEGRVRNAPQKKHYAEQLAGMTIDGVYYTEEMLMDMPIKSTAKKPPLLLPQLAEKANVRVLGDISSRQPSPLFWREPVERGQANRARQVERIADDAEQMALIRSGNLAVTKNPGEHCNWCQFNDLCDLDENRDETDEYIKAVYDVRDPYADHREGARNSKETVTAKKETGVQ